MVKVSYASAVGTLMYVMVFTRPNMTHAVGIVSRYMANPRQKHWEVVKWLLRYLRDTLGMTLCLMKNRVTLQGFVDADLDGDLDNRKIAPSYVFTLGGTTLSWKSRL